MTLPRRCHCGRYLSEYNTDKVCFPCGQRMLLDAMDKISQPKPETRGRKVRTHCPQGHEYNEQNSRMKSNGQGRTYPYCIICNLDRMRARRRDKKEARA